jgi:hypothetical protein
MKLNDGHNQNAASERARIALQIQAVVAPYRDHLVTEDREVRDGYRLRATSLLDGLDVAALPFPDLRDRLFAARAELDLT